MTNSRSKAAKIAKAKKSKRKSGQSSEIPFWALKPPPGPRELLIDGDEIARQVRKLVKKDGALERFKAEVVNWKRMLDRQEQAKEDWERRREDHFKAAQNDSRLRLREAGPPQDDWVFESTILRSYSEGGILVRDEVDAWCPPELSARTWPKVHSPTSFCDCSKYGHPENDPDRALSLCEKFVLLAAFHDVHCKGVEKINPFPEIERRISFDIMAFESVCESIKKLHVADAPVIEEFIEDVEAALDQGAYLRAFFERKRRERKEFSAEKPKLSDVSDVVLHFLLTRETFYRERLENDPTYNTNDPSVDVLIYDNEDVWPPSARPHYGATESEIDIALKEVWPGMSSAYFGDVIASLKAKNLIYRCDPYGVRFEESEHDFAKDENLVFRISEIGKRLVIDASQRESCQETATNLLGPDNSTESGREQRAPNTPVKEWADGVSPETPPRAEKAYRQFRVAVKGADQTDMTDRQAYDWLWDKYSQSDELDDLPKSFDSWRRNLSEFRRLNGLSKNKSRSSRAKNSRSIVHRADLDG